MTEPTFSEALEAGRLLTEDAYQRRVRYYELRAERRAILYFTLAVIVTLAIVVGCLRVAVAS